MFSQPPSLLEGWVIGAKSHFVYLMQAICWQDSFGNLKTNVLPEEVGFTVGESLLIQVIHSPKRALETK